MDLVYVVVEVITSASGFFRLQDGLIEHFSKVLAFVNDVKLLVNSLDHLQIDMLERLLENHRLVLHKCFQLLIFEFFLLKEYFLQIKSLHMFPLQSFHLFSKLVFHPKLNLLVFLVQLVDFPLEFLVLDDTT